MLLDSEIARIKAELGFNLLTIGAIPYIGITAMFEQVIQNNVGTGASTTSSTAVSAAATPTPVSLTLTSATGFQAGQRVVVDVDDLQEIATVRSISGASISVALKLSHAAGYPVTVESGETLVRESLKMIRDTKAKLEQQFGTGALKQVDEVQWYEARGQTAFGILGDNLNYWRDELAARLGIASMWGMRRGAAQQMSVY